MTLWTVPFPFRQRQVDLAVIAPMTQLARREEGSYRFKATPIPHPFVLQLAQKFTPTGITDGFGEMMVRQHALHIQALDIDSLALVYQSAALFMKKVGSLVGNFLMQTGDLHPRFLTVLAALLFSGKLALHAAQLLFRPAKVSGRIDLLSLRSDNKAFQPQVQSDFFSLALGWAVLHFYFAQE